MGLNKLSDKLNKKSSTCGENKVDIKHSLDNNKCKEYITGFCKQ